MLQIEPSLCCKLSLLPILDLFGSPTIFEWFFRKDYCFISRFLVNDSGGRLDFRGCARGLRGENVGFREHLEVQESYC